MWASVDEQIHRIYVINYYVRMEKNPSYLNLSFLLQSSSKIYYNNNNNHILISNHPYYRSIYFKTFI